MNWTFDHRADFLPHGWMRPGYKIVDAQGIDELRAALGERAFWRFVSQGGKVKPKLRVKAGREVVA